MADAALPKIRVTTDPLSRDGPTPPERQNSAGLVAPVPVKSDGTCTQLGVEWSGDGAGTQETQADGAATGSLSNGRTVSRLRRSPSPARDHAAADERRLSDAAIDPLSQVRAPQLAYCACVRLTVPQQMLGPAHTPLSAPRLRSPMDSAASLAPPTASEPGADAKQAAESTWEASGASANRERKFVCPRLPCWCYAPSRVVTKSRRKGVSFLSRIIGSKKRNGAADPASAAAEDASEASSGQRREGMDAQLFSHPVDSMGFSPRHPPSPAYIKVRAKFKKKKEFDRLFLAQELRPHSSASVWAMEFSKDGKYLAAAGQDEVVRVWAVISSPEERQMHETEEAHADGDSTQRLSAPVFRRKAHREYQGHTATILDLSWSKNSFLLSSSMDKTVRLWHVSRSECLCTFKHVDFVTAIQFHPQDDRFFLAGSLDQKLRLWSIPDKSVAYWAHLPEMITAVAFTPDGRTSIAGTFGGLCAWYETEGLKYQMQMHVKSTHGKNAKGSKITGIQAAHFPPGSTAGEVKLLVSTNDSRVRLYNARDKGLELKLRGHENASSQVRASFADDSDHIICGSEDRRAYLWFGWRSGRRRWSGRQACSTASPSPSSFSMPTRP